LAFVADRGLSLMLFVYFGMENLGRIARNLALQRVSFPSLYIKVLLMRTKALR
jgi:hypothetical protein